MLAGNSQTEPLRIPGLPRMASGRRTDKAYLLRDTGKKIFSTFGTCQENFPAVVRPTRLYEYPRLEKVDAYGFDNGEKKRSSGGTIVIKKGDTCRTWLRSGTEEQVLKYAGSCKSQGNEDDALGGKMGKTKGSVISRGWNFLFSEPKVSTVSGKTQLATQANRKHERKQRKPSLNLSFCVNCGKAEKDNFGPFLCHPFHPDEVLCKRCAVGQACHYCESRNKVESFGSCSLCQVCSNIGSMTEGRLASVKSSVLMFMESVMGENLSRLENVPINRRQYISAGFCSADTQTYGMCSCRTTFGKPYVDHVSVLSTLPEILFATFLSHEYLHAYFHLFGPPKRNHALEEALCTYMSLMFLVAEKKRLKRLTDGDAEESTKEGKAVRNLISFWVHKFSSKKFFESSAFVKIASRIERDGWKCALS